MTYKKVGGLHFVRIGRFGFSWFVSTKANQRAITRSKPVTDISEARMARAERRRLQRAVYARLPADQWSDGNSYSAAPRIFID